MSQWSGDIESQDRLTEYEELIAALRHENEETAQRVAKLELELDEKDEEFAKLREEYREIDDTREELEAEVNRLKSELSHKEARIVALSRKTNDELHEERLQEVQRLQRALQQTKRENEKKISKLEKSQMDKEAEYKRRLLHRQPRSGGSERAEMGVEDMQAAFDGLVEQYEEELAALRQMNEDTISSLEDRLDQAILDKEEIADGYLIEIERLELALNEAVGQITELNSQLRKTQGGSDVKAPRPKAESGSRRPSSKRLKFRSIEEVLIKDKKGANIATLPARTMVIISEMYSSGTRGGTQPPTAVMGRISEPTEYRGWVQLQSKGTPLLEPVRDPVAQKEKPSAPNNHRTSNTNTPTPNPFGRPEFHAEYSGQERTRVTATPRSTSAGPPGPGPQSGGARPRTPIITAHVNDSDTRPLYGVPHNPPARAAPRKLRPPGPGAIPDPDYHLPIETTPKGMQNPYARVLLNSPSGYISLSPRGPPPTRGPQRLGPGQQALR